MKTNKENVIAENIMPSSEKLFNFRPVFFSAVFLCFGIAFAYGHLLCGLSALWLLLWIPVLVLPLCFCRSLEKLQGILCAVVLLAVSFCVGAFSFGAQIDDYADCTYINGDVYLTGTVEEIVEIEDWNIVTFKDISINGNSEDGRLIAYLPTSFSQKAQISDVLILQGNIQTRIEYFDEFGFCAQEIADKQRYALFGASEVVKIDEDFDIFTYAQRQIRDTLHSGMDETPASVATALLTGDRSGIDEGLYDNIRAGGIAHIFAVSGLHVGAMFAFCAWLVERSKRLKSRTLLRFILVAVVLLFYAGICGFTSSVLRALVICLVGYAARLLLLTRDFLQSIGATAIVVLLISPVSLMNIGFQLSFAACLGIALLSRHIRSGLLGVCGLVSDLFPKRYTHSQMRMLEAGDTLPLGIAARIRNVTVSFLAVSFSAQIFTAPILLSTYGYLSGWGLLLNCIFVPLVSAIFSILLLLTAVCCLLPEAVVGVVMYVPNILFSGALLVFETVDFSSFALTGVYLSTSAYVSYYGGILFATDKLNVAKGVRRLLSGMCFLLFAITMVALNA